jgi:hypothetical protein
MTMRVLTTIGLMAWNQKGKQGVDPAPQLNGRDRWTRRSSSCFASFDHYVNARKELPRKWLGETSRSTLDVARR